MSDFVPSLMKYAKDQEEDIALLAAKSIQFLSSHPKNKEIMASNEDLVDCLVLNINIILLYKIARSYITQQ